MKKTTSISKLLRIASLFLVLNILLAISVKASIPDPILPQWQNTQSSSLTIDFYSSSIKVTVHVYGVDGASLSNGTLTLEKVTGEDSGVIQTWQNLFSIGSIFAFSNTVYVSPSAGRYKLTLNITVSYNGFDERLHIYSNELYS